MGDKKIYIVAKIFDQQGCIAYRCKTLNEARCVPGTLEALRADGVQIVILDSPEIYSEYAPYTYIELLLKNANFRSSINRSYYAIFHAIRAVNALDGFDSSKHSGVIAHFNQEYVKTGVFEKGASKIIRNASELREQADYEDFYEATQEEASDVFMQASQFISEVERYLHSKAIL